jgi:hypothetical protein
MSFIMSANLEQTILEKIQALPDKKQEEVLALVDQMLKEGQPQTPENVRPIWDIIEEIVTNAPPGTWDDVPTDGSVNHDHYLYGAPKQEP